MRTSSSMGILFFAVALAGCGEQATKPAGNSIQNSNAPTAATSQATPIKLETPQLSTQQQAALNGGIETKWEEQGLSWTLPQTWEKYEVRKDMFAYGSRNKTQLAVTVAVMPDKSFHVEDGLRTFYDQAAQLVKDGKYDIAKLITLGGVKGVEFRQVMPPEQKGRPLPRRHQWIGYRNYQGELQQINVTLSANATDFDKYKDEFTAVLYSMKPVN